ncbi:MAG: glycoside hydrolase family 65 protein, partial [Lachnospiraceae bacterium]|nr:glycoside hydrolase family 65 protein [Lachnospiraceae bacterium]
ADNFRNETTFALSNGYLGTRGTYEEGYDFPLDKGLEGNYINGFYESVPIRYGEWNYGFPQQSQSLLNLPNLKTTEIYIDNERLDLRTGTTKHYKRTLYLRHGLVRRTLIWESPQGKRIRYESLRFVSFTAQHVMAQRVSITPLNFHGEIQIVSRLDADVENHTAATNPLIDYGPYGRALEPASITAIDDMLLYRGRTSGSSLALACGSFHFVNGRKTGELYHANGLTALVKYTVKDSVTLDKFIAYASSLDMAEEKLADFISCTLKSTAALGFNELLEQQKAYAQSFWEKADIEIMGDDAIQQGLRFNLFHVMQAAGRNGRTGLGAKGLSGEGYEGHYFWDTEIYALPLFSYTCPDIAKALLDFRYNGLGAARERARELGHPAGALYPWRTINGQECSTYVPLGTAQYHINADIAYAFWQYVKITDDMEYLKTRAAEVLCETARVWADVGCFSEARDGLYTICCVTGPDEYTAFVDNNFYTNYMARENLHAATEAVTWLMENDPAAYQKLAEKIALVPDELPIWQFIADHMYLPYSEELGVYLQDDGFLMRKPWDDAQVPAEKRHLLYENYHPLFVWRQRMAKQADTVLALVLHDGHFDQATLARHYDFYQDVTLHHSSLSTCIFGILAARIGRYEDMYRYFGEAARMDLDDHHGNFHTGIHAANMAGTWLSVIYGLAGLRIIKGQLDFSPHLPRPWKGYRFRLRYQGKAMEVKVGKNGYDLKYI